MRARKQRERSSRPTTPPLPTNRPTEERRRLAEVIEEPDVNGRAFRAAWLIRSRLDGLYFDKLIDLATYEAGKSLARDYWLVGGAPGSPIARIALASAIASRIDAARRLRAVRARIGEGAYSLEVACAAEDTSWRELGPSIALPRRYGKERRGRSARASGGFLSQSG